MRLEHQIKNVINRIDEKAKDTPGQGGMKEHPISKKTNDYEEKYFQHASVTDDREKFITGKKPEQKDNIEDTEGHSNPAEKSKDKAPKESEEIIDERVLPSNLAMTGYIDKTTVGFILKGQMKYDWWPAIGQNGAKEDDKVVFKFNKPQGDTISGVPQSGKYKGKIFDYNIVKDNFKVPAAELQKHRLKEDMNIDLKQVKDLTEKKQEKEGYNVKMAAAALKDKSHMDMGGEKHPVKMDKKTAKKIMKDVKEGNVENVSFADAVRLAQETAVQSHKEYWEEAAKKRDEGWGGKGGVPGKGSVTTIAKAKKGGMTIGGK